MGREQVLLLGLVLSFTEGDDLVCLHLCFVPISVSFGFHALQQESM